VLSDKHPLLIAKIFIGYEAELCEMTKTGMMLYSTSFLFCGFNIFGSGFFTGLNNGVISACNPYYHCDLPGKKQEQIRILIRCPLL
jgi:hypothetical protein